MASWLQEFSKDLEREMGKMCERKKESSGLFGEAVL